MDAIAIIFNEIFTKGLERFGRYYSVYRATVHDNDDPDGHGRLRLIVPIVDKKTPYARWAWPKGNFSGNNYGMQVLPQKGDLVWVEFEHGDRDFPVWSHAYYTKNEKPKEFANPQVFGFKTPYGFTILADDSTKSLSITTPNKLVMEFKDKDGTVVIKSGEHNLFKISGDEILQVTSGDSIINQKDGKIFLGNKAKHPGVLGDKNEEVLNKLTGILEELTNNLMVWVATDSAPLAALGITGEGALAGKLPKTITDIQALKLKIKEITSEIVKLQ